MRAHQFSAVLVAFEASLGLEVCVLNKLAVERRCPRDLIFASGHSNFKRNLTQQEVKEFRGVTRLLRVNSSSSQDVLDL